MVKDKVGIDGKTFQIHLNKKAFEHEYCLSYLKNNNGIYILVKYNFFQKKWRKFKLFI